MRALSLRAQWRVFDVEAEISCIALRHLQRFQINFTKRDPVPTNKELLDLFVKAAATVNLTEIMEEFVYAKVHNHGNTDESNDFCSLTLALPRGMFLWSPHLSALSALGFKSHQIRSMKHMFKQYGRESFPDCSQQGFVVDNTSPHLRVHNDNTSTVWDCSAWPVRKNELVCDDLNDLTSTFNRLEYGVLRRQMPLGKMDAVIKTFETMGLPQFAYQIQKLIDDCLFVCNMPSDIVRLQVDTGQNNMRLQMSNRFVGQMTCDRPFAVELSLFRDFDKKPLSRSSVYGGEGRNLKLKKNKALQFYFGLPPVIGVRSEYPLKICRADANGSLEYMATLMTPEVIRLTNVVPIKIDTNTGMVEDLRIAFFAANGYPATIVSSINMELKYSLENEGESVHYK